MEQHRGTVRQADSAGDEPKATRWVAAFFPACAHHLAGAPSHPDRCIELS